MNHLCFDKLAGALVMLALTSFLGGTGLANAAPTEAEKNQALLQKINANPDMKVERLQPSPISGLYEAVIDGEIFYVDASGKYIINGQLFDMKEKTNLTLVAKASLKKIDPASLPIDDAFTIVRGNGKRHVYIFSDPDCPHCKNLEKQELPRITDVTIHIFLFPIVELHPDAARKAVGVWCAEQREQAWQNVMLRDVAPPTANCSNPVERNIALGKRLGINATPTLVFEDGKVIPGSMPAIQLEAMLGKGKP